jgi:hypothetical protein
MRLEKEKKNKTQVALELSGECVLIVTLVQIYKIAAFVLDLRQNKNISISQLWWW